MSAGLIWLLAGVIVCGAEMIHPGAFLLWIGLAACGVGAMTELLGIGFDSQVAAFAVLLAVLLAIPLLRRRRTAIVNVPDQELVGRHCRAIAFDGAYGRVRVGDGSWSARTVGGDVPAEEALLRIVGRDGTTLLVTPEDATKPGV
jgi:membrane protein implicated in regulation of membrane protease activity